MMTPPPPPLRRVGSRREGGGGVVWVTFTWTADSSRTFFVFVPYEADLSPSSSTCFLPPFLHSSVTLPLVFLLSNSPPPPSLSAAYTPD